MTDGEHSRDPRTGDVAAVSSYLAERIDDGEPGGRPFRADTFR
jgi:hypothetical protein